MQFLLHFVIPITYTVCISTTQYSYDQSSYVRIFLQKINRRNDFLVFKRLNQINEPLCLQNYIQKPYYSLELL
jgi:hypothetical protein